MTRWQIFGAVALRRLPEIIPRRNPIEVKVQQIFNAIEASKSRYSDHEIRQLDDKKTKDSEEIDVLSKETAQDMEDKWAEAIKQFKFAEHNDRLSKMQYLFMQAKFGTDIKNQWLLPQTVFDRKLGDKDLLDTARRALRESLNIFNGYTIISKVPSSTFKFSYPKKVRETTGFDGAQVFFLKAHLDLPSQSVTDAVDDAANKNLKWFTMDEARQNVSTSYLRGLAKGLIHEDRVNVDVVIGKASRYVATVRKISVNSY